MKLRVKNQFEGKLFTFKQLLKSNRLPLDGQIGESMYTNGCRREVKEYFLLEQTRPMTMEERRQYKSEQREHRGVWESERRDEIRQLNEDVAFKLDCHTSHQWLHEYNRIPLDNANWIQINESGYLYCHVSQTREPESEEELKKIQQEQAEKYNADPTSYFGPMM